MEEGATQGDEPPRASCKRATQKATQELILHELLRNLFGVLTEPKWSQLHLHFKVVVSLVLVVVVVLVQFAPDMRQH